MPWSSCQICAHLRLLLLKQVIGLGLGKELRVCNATSDQAEATLGKYLSDPVVGTDS